MVSADTTNVAALKYSARFTWSEPSDRPTRASRPKTRPATGAVPNVVNRLYWLACSSLSGGTRFGIEASLAGVQNSEQQDARNWTTKIQVSSLTRPRARFSGMDAYSAARITSLMIMFIRRSSRSATAPASGPSSSAGSNDVSQTPPTAEAWAATPRLARIVASAVSASRLSQSPRLDRDVAIHRRRNGLMDSTLPLPVSPGNRKVTALGYRSCRPRAARLRWNALAHGDPG